MLDIQRITDMQQRLSGADAKVSKVIHEKDNMYAPGQNAAYMGIGKRALHEIVTALILSPETQYTSIMDFPSGWGRVTRWIRAAFPESEIGVSEIIPGAADIARSNFRRRSISQILTSIASISAGRSTSSGSALW